MNITKKEIRLKSGESIPAGSEVEPDGIDPEGSPSWFLAMGLI